ncbi:MAG: hypothetical protein RL042_1007 [Nitrospirota bacterium]|jgi:hypothetical protein
MKSFLHIPRWGKEVLFANLFVALLSLGGCITVDCAGNCCGKGDGSTPPACATTQVPAGGAGSCTSGATCTDPGVKCALGKVCKTVNVGGVCSCECLR